MKIPALLLRFIPPPLAARLVPRLASSLGGRLAGNTVWSFGGAVGSRLLSVITTVALARILGRQGMGEFGMLQSTTGMFSILAGFGLNLAATRFVSELRAVYPVRAGRCASLALGTTLVSGLAAAAILFAASGRLAEVGLKAPALAPLLRLSAIFLFANAVSGVMTGILLAVEDFRSVSLLTLAQTACGLALMPAGALWRGVEGVIMGQIAAMAVMVGGQSLALGAACRAGRLRFHWSGLTRELHMLWRFALPAFLSNAVIIPFVWLSQTFLIRRPHGYEEMGAFAVGLQWFNLMLIIPNLLGDAALPVMSERMGASDWPSALKIWKLSLWFNTGVVVALAVVISTGGRLIMRLYGPAFAGYHAMLALIVAAGAAQGALDSAAKLLVLRNRMWLICLMNLGFGLACATGSYWMVSAGALGLAGARLLAYAVHGLWLSAAVLRVRRGLGGGRAAEACA